MKKNIAVIAAVAVVIIGIGVYLVLNTSGKDQKTTQIQETQITPAGNQDSGQIEENTPPATIDNVAEKNPAETTQPPAKKEENNNQTIIGKSVGGGGIMAYHYGTGEKEILFVGGIHGGYSFNTVLLAEQLANTLSADPSLIPANVKITIIQNLNPDGSGIFMANAGRFNDLDASSKLKIRTESRFNAHKVDLNRNFDCNWKADGIWQNKTVSGGTAAFSEPESAAIRDYAQQHKLAAVIAWYASGGGIYSSSCGNGVLPETQTINNLYAKASGYASYNNFESYQVSGDMTDWFAKNNIPAIGILLDSSDNEEWDKNYPGIKAIIDYYSK